MNEETKGLLRKIHELLGEALGETSAGAEEISEEIMLAINLSDLTDEDLDELQEQGIITWVSAEGDKRVIIPVEDEEASAEGNTSDTPTEMLKSEPHDNGTHTVSFASEKGAHAIVTIDNVQIRSIYKVGETVVTVNPYTHEHVHEDLDGTPLYFIVSSIAYDSQDDTFRYLIDGEGEWVSEEWLDKPMVSMMSKVFVEINTEGASGMETAEKKTGLQTSLDEMLEELSINTYLEMMSSDIESNRAHAIRMLHKIAEKYDSTTEEAQ